MDQDGNLVSQRAWEFGAPYPADKVSVRNISLTANAGLDVWGRKKEQPVFVSVSLSLARSFQSAAEGDVVDSSTVHYGRLSKNIISSVKEKTSEDWRGTHELAKLVREACLQSADSPNIIGASEVEIYFPKSSMLGDGAGYRLSTNHSSGDTSRVLYIKNIRVPTIIGVNSHERWSKQAVVANLWIDKLLIPRVADLQGQAEKILTETVGNSNFETLESLATTVAAKIEAEFFQNNLPGASIRLRVEKPVAVPFADAPAIEIVVIKKD
ncbi:hypothetical protein H2201_006249 [Coniosporium apollinis]|uniref:dihydroneopterin aldolase n=2 Tax=Coniosporium TaxID=2810619 RepID=A0ABQ9NMS4_9PEZI|nr:hypothetical protein H2199_007945 [Cladosporium sp. JES 115]KAJ9662141.1 hypothetical protein H2201_006249 [Coniosporium apollinis]